MSLSPKTSQPDTRPFQFWLPWLALALLLILAFLFSGSFKPDQAHFANDGPLGAQASRIYDMPSAFFGIWSDLYWVGANGGNYTPNFTGVLLWLLGPIGFNKFIVPSALLILGLSAGLFFRQLKFQPVVCVLAGLAAALNSNFLSNACWGLPSRALSLAAMFLALAAFESSFNGRPLIRLLKLILAGLGIGLSVSEGGDNGAIFSLFFAGYVCWLTWTRVPAGESPVKRLTQAALASGVKLGVIVVFAFLLAAQIVDIFFGFTGTGIAALGQKEMSREQKWSWATQWSLPKAETLRVIVPGLFGYRLDTPQGGNYWGGVGQDPAWEEGHKNPEWVKANPGAFPRHSGAGEYAGILVVLIALWALAHSFAKGSAFAEAERRMIWFWGGAVFVSMLLSWGRHAPFYQIVYALPYFSTIRNPMKFMHPAHMSLMILFAYGLQGMWRRYLEPSRTTLPGAKPVGRESFDRKWVLGSGIGLAVAVLGYLLYAFSSGALVRHLEGLGFDPQIGTQIAKFSLGEVGWSVFFLAASVIAVLMISKGAFSGPRAKWGAVVLGVILVADLARANSPWIQYYNYKEKYASNGVFELLSKNAHEHRFTLPPLQADRNFSIFQQIYGVEWLQHQFPYFSIQALDQPQEPRMPPDKAAYREALGANFVRLWELTNTRFIGGMAAGFAEALNQQFDAGKQRFKLHTRFNFFQNAGGAIGARVDENGPFALIEFTGALPRARLYSQWEVNTNNQATLARLADPNFDPHQAVLVADPISPPPANAGTATAGSVEFASYAPKRVELRTEAAVPTVLLLNDKFAEGWTVTIDGQPGVILRANFLMRGVQLPSGKHTVVFRYRPPSSIFYVSLGATVFGLLLCGMVWFDSRRRAP